MKKFKSILAALLIAQLLAPTALPATAEGGSEDRVAVTVKATRSKKAAKKKKAAKIRKSDKKDKKDKKDRKNKKHSKAGSFMETFGDLIEDLAPETNEVEIGKTGKVKELAGRIEDFVETLREEVIEPIRAESEVPKAESEAPKAETEAPKAEPEAPAVENNAAPKDEEAQLPNGIPAAVSFAAIAPEDAETEKEEPILMSASPEKDVPNEAEPVKPEAAEAGPATPAETVDDEPILESAGPAPEAPAEPETENTAPEAEVEPEPVETEPANEVEAETEPEEGEDIEAEAPEAEEIDAEAPEAADPDAVREKILGSITPEKMDPVDVEGETERTVTVPGPDKTTSEVISEEEMWFSQGEEKLKELRDQGWEPIPGINGVMKTDDDGVTIYVVNAPSGWKRLLNGELQTSKKFTTREEALEWIAEKKLDDYEIEESFATSTMGTAYHGFTDYQEADQARIAALTEYLVKNGNDQSADKGFIMGKYGGVSDHVFKRNIFEWSDEVVLVTVGEIRTNPNGYDVENAVRERIAKQYDVDPGDIEITLTNRSNYERLPIDIEVTLKKPYVYAWEDSETGEKHTTDSTREFSFTFEAQQDRDSGEALILPTSGKSRVVGIKRPTKKIVVPVEVDTPLPFDQTTGTSLEKGVKKGLNWLVSKFRKKETKYVTIEVEDDDPNFGFEYGYYEFTNVPLYQASGRRATSGVRSVLTVTQEKIEKTETVKKLVTPLEQLRMSYAITWETGDGRYTCHGVKLEDGRRATEYYDNETGELVATVPMG